MTDTATIRHQERPAVTTRPHALGDRRIARRRPLPNPRAIVGAFLVAASAFGSFAAYTRAGSAPTQHYVVARHDIDAGIRITAEDLTTVAVDLPATTAAHAYRSPRELVGSVTAAPVRAGALLQAGSVLTTDVPPGHVEVSFPIETARALGGALRSGDVVDVLATFGSAGESYTTTVVQGARVRSARDAGGGLTASGAMTVTLSVASADDARAVAHALDAGKLLLVRADAADAADDRSGVYRAEE